MFRILIVAVAMFPILASAAAIPIPALPTSLASSEVFRESLNLERPHIDSVPSAGELLAPVEGLIPIPL